MRFHVGVTDNAWFEFLRRLGPDEVNFWRPSGKEFSAATYPRIEPPLTLAPHLPVMCATSAHLNLRLGPVAPKLELWAAHPHNWF